MEENKQMNQPQQPTKEQYLINKFGMEIVNGKADFYGVLFELEQANQLIIKLQEELTMLKSQGKTK